MNNKWNSHWNSAISFCSGEWREFSRNGFSSTEVTNISEVHQHAGFCWVNYKLPCSCRMTASSCLTKAKCNFTFQRVNQSTPPRVSNFKNYHQRTHLNPAQLLPAASNRCTTYSRLSPIPSCPSHLSEKVGRATVTAAEMSTERLTWKMWFSFLSVLIFF